MQALYDVPAPAKLNLFLHITGRRADGYHLLQSVFMLIDWCDTLHFERRAGGALSREDLGPALPEMDLVLRAAHALQAATGCTEGAHIGITKRIPAQAGMGGGSSDAASTLLALNRLWGLNLSRQALQKIGLALGADVPFFFYAARTLLSKELVRQSRRLRMHSNFRKHASRSSSPQQDWRQKQFFLRRV